MSELLEREQELTRIRQVLSAGRAGGGRALIFWGAAGIGKSSLLAAARVSAGSAGTRVLRARGGELEREYGFGVVRQLFEPVLAAAPATERADWLDGAAGQAARLLGLPGASPAPAVPSGPADSLFTVLHGLYWLCAQLADDGPVCLMVDDAQWADTASLRFLAFLLPRLEELRVTVLAAVRAGEEGPAADLLTALSADPAVETYEPLPLSRDAVGRLLAAALGKQPDTSLVAGLHRASGGVPFLVEQLTSRLHDDGDVSPERIGMMAGPGVARWVLARLTRLGSPAVRLARAVAILEAGELGQAAELAGLSRNEAAAAQGSLAGAGILAPSWPLRFTHPIVRRSVYDAMDSAERSAGHRHAARLLAAAAASDELVAEHLLAGEPADDPWVVDRLACAADTAARSGASESAAAYLRRGLAEPPQPAQRSGLLLQLGLAEFNAGHPGAISHLEQSVDTAADDSAWAASALALAYALVELHDDRIVAGVQVLDEAIASFGGDDTPLVRSVETVAVAVARLDADLAARNQSRIRAARQRAEASSAPSREVLALAALIAMQTNEPARVAADLARRSLRARSEPLPGSVALPRQSLIQAEAALVWSGCYDELRPVLDTTIRDARNSGDALLLTGSLAYRAWLALHLGDLRAAEADARTVLEAAMPAPAFHRVLNTAAAVDALTGQGRLADAEKVLAAEAGLVEGGMPYDASLRLSRGRLRLAQRRADEALADFLSAGEVAVRLGLDSPGWLPWRSCAAVAALAVGDRGRARGLAASELELARVFGAPRTLGVALHTTGLTSDDPRRSEELLGEAVASLGRAGAVLDRARALCDLGALLRRTNRRADSRELLREALDIAHRAGAAPLAARAETELRATGARPRRAVLAGADALTASERRIAELAAAGLTNRQIAQSLFITTRTVEGHLTSVFRKLTIDSREDLPAAL